MLELSDIHFKITAFYQGQLSQKNRLHTTNFTRKNVIMKFVSVGVGGKGSKRGPLKSTSVMQKSHSEEGRPFSINNGNWKTTQWPLHKNEST